MRSIFFQIVLLGTLSVSVNAHRGISFPDRRVKFTGIRCKSLNEKVLRTETCLLNATAPNCFTVEMYQHINVVAPKARQTLYISEKERPPRKLYSIEIDLCNLVVNSRRNLLKLYLKQIVTATKNFPHHCPFKKNIVYGLNNICFPNVMLPSIWTKMNMTASVEIFDVTLGSTYYLFEIDGLVYRA